MNQVHGRQAAAKEVSLDAFSLYLNELSLHPILTAEDEVRLAQEIIAGKHAACRLEDSAECDPGKPGALDPDERDELLCVVHRGARAREQFAEGNLRLVVSIAKRYQGRGLDLPDLVQEGNCGLLRALDRFDCTLGYRFSTYATWWIRQAIGRALAEKARVVRLPVHVAERVNRQRRVRRELVQALGREPTFEEVVAEMGLLAVDESESSDRAPCTPADAGEGAVARRTKAIEEASVLHALMAEPVSLDCALENDETSNLGDLLMDERAEDPLEVVARHALVEELATLLNRLTERERYVLTQRFGLEDGSECTLEAIAQRLNLTRERVRQIQVAAIRKLRIPRQNKRLRELITSA